MARRNQKGFQFTTGSFLAFGGLVIAAVVAVVFAVYQCSPSFSQARLAAADERALQAIIDKQQSSQNINEEDIPSALAEAKEVNADVCAWVYVPNTNVSLPILQSLDDDRKYVDESLDNSNEVLGATFIEKVNSPFFIDPLTVVYGHAFEDEPDVMLGQLHKFEDKDFFDQNDTFYIYLDEKRFKYKIACACPYVGDHVISLIKASDSEALQRYMTFAMNPGVDSRFIRDVGEVDADVDRIVQFSTCTFPSSSEYRYVVTGVLVGEEWL